MFNFYDILTKFTKTNNINAIIIGAMDGISHDNIGDFVGNDNWQVVFVEPVEHYMNQLKTNFGINERFTFLNLGISDKNEPVEFVMLDPAKVESGKLNRGHGGLTTIFPPKNCMKSLINEDQFKDDLIRIKFDCITVNNMMNLIPFTDINYLQIDTEGYDWMILRQFTPTMQFIKIESGSLTTEEKTELNTFLQNNNYEYYVSNEDTYAIRKEVLNNYV